MDLWYNVDAVILCAWPGQHLEQIEKCLSSGVKNILCEKSLTVSSDEALSIQRMAEKEGAFIIKKMWYSALG